MNTTNTISQSIFIWSLLGSTVVATIVGFVLGAVKEFFQSQREENREREEKLYSSLRFYSMLIDINAETRKELLDSRQKADKIANFIDPDDKRMKKFQEDNRELIGNWWSYARKILTCFENAPQYIKKEHQPLVEKIFKTHVFRKVVSGEEVYKDAHGVYDDEVFLKDNSNEFVEALNELYRQIK